jgi:hypothetical protein
MTPSLRKLVLTAHITVSVGWLGAVIAFLALAIAGLTSRDAQMVRTSYAAMELTARFVIVPLAFASLLTGLIESLGTPWGLFRNYWVLAKLLLTTFATIVWLACAVVFPFATATSICRNKLTICAGLCFFPRAVQRSSHTSLSHSHWYGKRPAGHQLYSSEFSLAIG